MNERAVQPIPPQAILGPSDWDDEDLLTVAEASERLADEIRGARERVRLTDGAAERARLDALLEAAERIRSGQANAPR